MTRRKATPAKMLKAIERGALNGRPQAAHSVFALIKEDPSSSPEMIAYAWEREARRALRIEDLKFAYFPDADGKPIKHDVPPDFVDYSARALRLTFEKFHLDPDDPWSWRRLAGYLSMIFFWNAPGKRGRKMTWTPEKLMKLEREAAAWGDLPDTKKAKRLAKTPAFTTPGVDARAGVEGLRKRLRQAKRHSGTAVPGKNRGKKIGTN